MDWITGQIAIGGRADAADAEALRTAGIAAVLQLYGPERDPLRFPFAQAVLDLFVVDGEPLPPEALAKGVAFIFQQQRLGRPLFVTCGAGMSRSPVFVAAYFHEEGMGLLDALRLVVQARPQALPHPALLRSLVDRYRPPQTTEDLLIELVRARTKAGPQQPRGLL